VYREQGPKRPQADEPVEETPRRIGQKMMGSPKAPEGKKNNESKKKGASD